MDFKKFKMKNLFLQFLILLFVLSSCTKEDKYEGTPISNKQDIETINGTIVSNTMFALPGQFIDFTATLPVEFINIVNQDINIEVQTSTLGGSLRRSSVKVLKGQNIVTGKVLVGGGDGTFYMPVKLKLNAVKLTTEITGKHFLLTSDSVTINSGVTSVPVDDDRRLQIKIAWESLQTGNNLTCNISRVGSVALTLRGSVSSGADIKITGTAYPFTFNTDLVTTATNFVTNYSAAILTNKNIIVTSVGKSIFFKYSTPTAPLITINSTTTPANTLNLNGATFSSFNFQPGSSLSAFKQYPILNSQILSSSASGLESVEGGFNEGDFAISLKPAILETTPVDVKYRIIIKKPSGEVFIYNGVLLNATTASLSKKVLTFSKSGYGDAAVYDYFIFTP